jgi:DNA mismatch repair ATPase MutS
VPVVVDGPPRISARGLVHPAIASAIANDVELADRGLVITGSNMSGKSTFLRAVAINAICAQAIATTFGSWRATVFRVRSTMRIADDTARGTSTFAVEVAAIGAQLARVRRDDAEPPALFVIDEPFRGTNPAIRVPIAIAVVDYLGERDLTLVATHDLDVAAQLDPRFARGYFDDRDHRLRPGIAPATNAVALLVAADYPEAIVAEIRRRVSSS